MCAMLCGFYCITPDSILIDRNIIRCKGKDLPYNFINGSSTFWENDYY